MEPCSIAVDLSGPAPVFSFSARNGEVRIIQLNLWRDGVESPWWTIVVDNPPERITVDLAEHGSSVEEAMRAEFERGVARISSGVGSLCVTAITFPSVPAGFRQQYPRQGEAPSLQPGLHHLSVSGGNTGWLSFVVPGDQ
jgi:hypothetical protein